MDGPISMSRHGQKDDEYRIKPKPKMRPMTRGEVLYMVTTTPGMVIRYNRERMEKIKPEWVDGASFEINPANIWCARDKEIGFTDYAIIDRHGNPIDGWHKIEDDGIDATEK
jgi:hypothetical protein